MSNIRFVSFVFLAILTLSLTMTYAQKRIAITIDDVPNTRKYESDGFRSIFLKKIDSLHLSVTAFVNEKSLFQTTHYVANFDLLHQWISSPNVQIANHSFNHLRCSATDDMVFIDDIRKGGHLIGELSGKYNKKVQYFRFPYNDLGKDASQQMVIRHYLDTQNLIIAPFTVESSDWMFNFLYVNHLRNQQPVEAKRIAHAYLQHTRNNLRYFDSLATLNYGREIPHIYLCHDNLLNQDYLDDLLLIFRQEGFQIVSMDEAMKDEVYQQTVYYQGKWGFSWLYRWMQDEEKRKKAMAAEPSVSEYYQAYEELQKK